MILVFDNIKITLKHSKNILEFFNDILHHRKIDEDAFYHNNIREGIKFSVILQKILKLDKFGDIEVYFDKIIHKNTIGEITELCTIEHEDNLLDIIGGDTPLYSPFEMNK